MYYPYDDNIEKKEEGRKYYLMAGVCKLISELIL